MNEELDKAWLTALQRQLEQHLQWGPIASWSQRDFQNLSDQLQEKTGVLISVSTLKRALGRVEFKGMPFHTTLNALVQLMGHKSWAQFKTSQQLMDEPTAPTLPAAHVPDDLPAAPASRTVSKLLLGAAMLFVAVISAGAAWWLKPAPDLETEQGIEPAVLHASLTQSDTTPFTVHFEYEVPKRYHDDLLLLSMGDNKQHLRYANLNKEGKGQHQFKYDEHGFFMAKLFANKKILARLPILVATATWQTTIGLQKQELPVQPSLKAGVLTVDQSELDRRRADTLQRVRTNFKTYRNFGVDADDCRIVMRLRSPASVYNAGWPKTTIKLGCLGGNSHITLDKSQTVIDIFNQFSDHVVDSASQFKHFVQDISEWSELELKTHNMQWQLSLNGKPIYSGQYTERLKNLYSLIIGFRGIGEIDYVQVYNGAGQIRYREDF